MAASGMTAPEASRTVPEMDPVPRSGCAMAAVDNSTQQIATVVRLRIT
jgi:transcriptional accessory protein Tex/SPT6